MKRTQGLALITVLIIVAIAAAIASNIMARIQSDINRTALSIEQEKMLLDTHFVTAWAQAYYATVLNSTNTQTAEAWPAIFPTQTLNDGNILTGSMMPAGAFFNLNNLKNEAYINIFANLLKNVDPKLSQEQAMRLTLEITQAINQTPLISPSQLRLISDMSTPTYQALLPYVIAIPDLTSFNPNAASQTLFLSLGLPADIVGSIMSKRNAQQNFSTIDEFIRFTRWQGNTSSNNGQNTQLFDLKDQYFIVQAEAKSATIHIITYTILKLNAKQNTLVMLQTTQHGL